VALSVSAAGVTATVEADWLTVTEAESVTPATVAVIVAVPLATAVTKPVKVTVATSVGKHVHVNV
jgi:hypothetical protein